VQIVSDEGEVVLDEPIQRILERQAEIGLSTLAGRLQATARRFQLVSKVPLWLAPDLLLFPIRSLRSPRCLLLNYYAVRSFQKSSEGSLRVRFDRGATLEVPAIIFCRQYAICERIDRYLSSLR